MYPFVRMIWQMAKHRSDPVSGPDGMHISQHYCLPWDIDLWGELNNGRTLTLYDLGRIPAARSFGLLAALRRRRWGMTMAGVTVRYRRRVRALERIEMRTTLATWDHRFLYIEQSMWRRDGQCANHALYRGAITSAKGIVPPQEVLAEMGHDGPAPAPPPWIAAWIAAENNRPWPPTHDR